MHLVWEVRSFSQLIPAPNQLAHLQTANSSTTNPSSGFLSLPFSVGIQSLHVIIWQYTRKQGRNSLGVQKQCIMKLNQEIPHNHTLKAKRRALHHSQASQGLLPVLCSTWVKRTPRLNKNHYWMSA